MRMPIVFIAVCICILFEEAAWEIKRRKVQKKCLIITAWIVSLACSSVYSFILIHHSNRFQVLLNLQCRIRATFQNLHVINATGSTYRKLCKQCNRCNK